MDARPRGWLSGDSSGVSEAGDRYSDVGRACGWAEEDGSIAVLGRGPVHGNLGDTLTYRANGPVRPEIGSPLNETNVMSEAPGL